MPGELERATITKAEWRWLLIAATIIAVLSCLPYVYASVAGPVGHTFGGFLINVTDGNSYLAKMRQGYEGEWLYRLAFSPEEQRGIFVFTLYLGLGHLARIIGLPLVIWFHATRIVGVFVLFYAVYALGSVLSLNISARRWILVIVAFGSGLGLVSQLIGRATTGFVPVDFYTPEANTFYSLLTNPHFPLMAAFEALALLWVLQPPFPRWPLAAQCGLLAFLGLGIVSMAPYLGPVIGVVVVAGLIMRWPLDRATLIRTVSLAIPMIALLAYNLWELQTNPSTALWAQQNITESPPFLDTLLGFGVWLPLALVGAWRTWSSEDKVQRAVAVALLAWIVLTLILMYVPYALQRRFIGGSFVPVALLAGVGAYGLVASLTGIRRALLLAGLVAFGFSTNALIILITFTAPRQANEMMYLTDDEAAALNWLEPRVTYNDVVLADSRLGTFVSGWTGARSVYGHTMETINAQVKRQQVDAYYADGVDTTLLNQYNIKYVIGGTPPPGWQVVFQSGTLTIYGR
jgi:hypothetical protein